MNKSLFLFLLLGFAACRDVSERFDATGVFEATEVCVSARQPGELLAFSVEEGQTLCVGSSVGTIDTSRLVLQRRRLRAEKKAAIARRLDVAEQTADLRQHWRNLDAERRRFSGLADEQAAPRKQVDDIERQMLIVERQIAARRASIAATNRSLDEQASALEAQMAHIDEQIRTSRIVAPVSGTVLTTYAAVGEYAAPGRPLFKMADLRRMYLRAYLSAGQINGLRIGQKVTVYADLGRSDRKAYRGAVTWIAQEAEFTPKTIQTRDERANLVYAVKIRIDNDGTVKRGMYGEMKL